MVNVKMDQGSRFFLLPCLQVLPCLCRNRSVLKIGQKLVLGIAHHAKAAILKTRALEGRRRPAQSPLYGLVTAVLHECTARTCTLRSASCWACRAAADMLGTASSRLYCAITWPGPSTTSSRFASGVNESCTACTAHFNPVIPPNAPDDFREFACQ